MKSHEEEILNQISKNKEYLVKNLEDLVTINLYIQNTPPEVALYNMAAKASLLEMNQSLFLANESLYEELIETYKLRR